MSCKAQMALGGHPSPWPSATSRQRRLFEGMACKMLRWWQCFARLELRRDEPSHPNPNRSSFAARNHRVDWPGAIADGHRRTLGFAVSSRLLKTLRDLRKVLQKAKPSQLIYAQNAEQERPTSLGFRLEVQR